jgi:F-type H+-transporting ATPase subunit epsilon
MAETQKSAAAPHSIRCVVVTPEQAVLDEDADFIALPMYDGELGVAPGRAAFIGRLGYGELRVKRGDQEQRYYVDGGFAQVRQNVATVLTSKAVPVAEISLDAAEKALDSALAAAAQDPDGAMKQQLRARAQIRVAKGHG